MRMGEASVGLFADFKYSQFQPTPPFRNFATKYSSGGARDLVAASICLARVFGKSAQYPVRTRAASWFGYLQAARRRYDSLWARTPVLVSDSKDWLASWRERYPPAARS